MGLAKEFPIEKMDGFRIGNAQNEEAGTGVTVVLFDKDKGARAGVDVSGGGPASRETPLASPLTADNPVNAIVLSGGWKNTVSALTPDMPAFRWYASPVSMTWVIKEPISVRMQPWVTQPARMHCSITKRCPAA